MEYITLKNSDLNVSRLCMGGCPMGGYGWGDTQEKDFLDAINAAIDAGLNFFDTADTYGLGQSEITLGKGLGNRRKDVVIETKFGVRYSNGKSVYDNSPEYIQEALEKSLKNLNTDYVDIYVIHYRDGKTPIEEVIGMMEDLKKQGKIRYFGLSNYHGDEANELIPFKDKFVCCQDEYSLACRKNENDLTLLRDQYGLTPLTWGSLGQGILTGKYNKESCFAANDRRSRKIYVNFHGDKLLKNLEIVEAMKPIAEAHKVSLAAVAVRFIMDYLKESVVLVGAKRPSQILGSIEAVDWNLTESEIKTLEKLSKE